MWYHKGVIARPETEIYYYLRGEKQARRRQGEKATLSSVLLELAKEGIKLRGKGIGIVQNTVPEYKYQQTSNLSVNQYKAQPISDEDESYNIIEWIDDVEKLKEAKPEAELRDEINPSVQEVLLTDDTQIEVNNEAGKLVEGSLVQTQAPQVEEVPEEKLIAQQEEAINYINKIPIGNRMSGCTTIWHKQAAFQIETTTQQQRLIWLIRDCGLPLEDFFKRTGISMRELLGVFLTNVDSVSNDIMNKACNGFRQYNLKWLKEGSEYSPYNNVSTSDDNTTEHQHPLKETSASGNTKKKIENLFAEFNPAAYYASCQAAEAIQQNKNKKANDLLGGLVQGLLNHKQKEADLQGEMNKADRPQAYIGVDENKNGKPPPEGTNLADEKKELTPVEGVLEKYKPVLDGFMEMAKPFAESFIEELLEAYMIQYPETA